jgi:hypothetical protein
VDLLSLFSGLKYHTKSIDIDISGKIVSESCIRSTFLRALKMLRGLRLFVMNLYNSMIGIGS